MNKITDSYRNMEYRIYQLDNVKQVAFILVGDQWVHLDTYSFDRDVDDIELEINLEIDMIIDRGIDSASEDSDSGYVVTPFDSDPIDIGPPVDPGPTNPFGQHYYSPDGYEYNYFIG